MPISLALQEQMADVLTKVEDEIRAQYDSGNNVFTGSTIVSNYFRLRLSGEDREHFEVAFLDSAHRLITTERMFSGTIDSAAVYPREIVKTALQHNARAIILAHNHPSGSSIPSQADIKITHRIKEAAQLVELAVLDHIIVGSDACSMAKQGHL